MLFYTTLFFISFLVAVPITILIYQTISSVHRSGSDFSGDELVAATGRISGQNGRATPLKPNNAIGTIRRNPDSVKAFREENSASADRSFKVAETKALAPKARNPGSVSKPFSPSLPLRVPNVANGSRPWGW